MSKLDMTPGRWAVVNASWYGGYRYMAARIDRVTDKMVYVIEECRTSASRFYQTDVAATFADQQGADHLVQAIDGVSGEVRRRTNAAKTWGEQAIAAKIAAARGEA